MLSPPTFFDPTSHFTPAPQDQEEFFRNHKQDILTGKQMDLSYLPEKFIQN